MGKIIARWRFVWLLAVLGISAHGQIVSNFDTDTEGWGAINGSSGDPQWLVTGGSSGGGIFLRDGAPLIQGAYFLAPSKFLGNQINAYGENLTFDLWVGAAASTNATDGDLQLIGSSSSLFLNLPFLPPSTFVWTTYSVRLDESANWRVGSIGGAVATASQVQAVLSSLTEIRINGEYASSPGSTARLDGVILNQIPPAITSFTPEEGPVASTVVISGSGFSNTPSLNTVRFNGVLATVSASSPTSVTVVVPAAATSGRIEVTVNGQSTLSSSVFCIPATPPSTFGLVAHYPFSGNALDASGNGNGGTVNGATLASGPFGTPNSAYQFNGSSAFIQVPNSTSLTSPANELTLSAWVNFQSQPFGPILSKSTSTPPGMYSFGVNANDRIYVQLNSVSNRIEIPFTFCPTQWYQITAVLEPSAVFVYVDGTLVGSQTFTTSILLNTQDLQIGRQGSEYLNGRLDEVRIYNRALSACEVAAIFSPADDPVITAVTPSAAQSGTAVTITGTGFDPVATNNIVRFNGTAATVLSGTSTSLNVRVPFGATTGPVQVLVGCNSSISSTPFTVIPFLPTGNTVTMNGTTDWIEVADDPLLRPASFTLEAWVKFASVSGNYTILSKAWSQPSSDNSFILSYTNGFLQGGINFSSVFHAWSPAPNVWYHVAFSFDEPSQTQTLYLNGVSVATGSATHVEYDDGALAIGGDIESGAAAGFFHGEMEEVRLWDFARDEADIQATLYSPLNGIEPGLLAYYNMDESGAGENLAVNNNASSGAALNGTTRGTRCTPVFSLGPPPSLVSFTPTSGAIGVTITIVGTGFSTTPAENEVLFNGRSGSIISATAAQLQVRVPPGAATGSLAVRVNCAESVFATSFTVLPFTCPPSTRTGGDLDVTFNARVEDERTFRAIQLQSSGKSIVSIGFSVPMNGNVYEGIVRLNTDGSVDNTFANPANYYPERGNLVVLPNDSILVVETGTESYVRRLDANGALDNTFNSPGYYASTIHSIGFQQDGKVLLSVLDGMTAPPENFIYRLEDDGTPDASFTPFAGFEANVIRQLPSGKILLGGSGVVILNEDGSLDTSFSPIIDGTVNDLVVQSDGKIVIVGSITTVNGQLVNGIARLNPNGTLDETFSTGNGLQPASGEPNAIRALPSGGFAIVGRFATFNNVLRTRVVVINDNGSLRCGFDPGSGPDAEVKDLAVQTDGKILIAGGFLEYDGLAIVALVRLNNAPASCVPTAERNALIALYNATNGPSWSFRDNWLSDDESQWFGVGVTGCHVTTISMQNNNLNGTLPVELGNLTQLKNLILAQHPNLSGSIPSSLGNLNSLERLSLWQNQLSGPIPTTLGNLTNLDVMELMFNQFSGNIPVELGNLATLDTLRLDANQLTGTIPTSLYGLTTLELLGLDNNQLTGTISPLIANLSNLTVLGLSQNQFTGSIPTELGNIVSLQWLGLARNQFTGALPASLGNLVNLRGFSVFTNQLSGTVPASLGNLVNLIGLGLSVNQFSGDLPASIGLIPGLTDVSLRDNDFTSIPTFVSTAFTDLLVFGNKLHFGHLEPNMGKGGFVYAPQDNLPGGTATACEGSTLTINFTTPGAANVYQWYKDGVLIPGATSATFTKTNSTAADAGSYSVQVTNTIVTGLTLTSDPFVVTIPAAPVAPVAAPTTICSGTTATLTASGGSAGQYRWYTVATGGTALAGETNATFTTPALTANTDYFVSINNGSCESARTAVTVTVNAAPTAPTASAPPICSGTTATITASGGSAGQYRWYTVATGGTALPGETNATFTTPALTANTDYFVSINNGSCESARTAVTVAVNALPAKPTITASGPLAICANQSVTLTAPAGFTYLWSTGATTSQISVTTAGSYTVVVRNTAGCSSVPSDPTVVTIISCTVNQPPAIAATTATTVINGIATIRLTDLISDPDNNLNFSSLRIVSPPLSGAQATIDSNFNLVLNYANVQFAGRDEIVIEVCDQGGLCVQQRIFIEVAGDIVVFTGISPNEDAFNNTWIIQNIDTLPDTRENKVSIFNRWGDLIWAGDNYDNRNVVFTGVNNNGNEVASGTYFYKIEFASGRETKTGFIAVRR